MLDMAGYRLLGLVQATGANLLYRAERLADGMRVIIKTPAAQHSGPRERERYRREYAILQRLAGTPGVIAAHGCESLQERPVLLLEDVGGQALSEQVGVPLELPRFFAVATSLATTLAEVHRRGVIHKDVKPSNVLLGPAGQVWLIDFGIASLQRVEHVDAEPGHHMEGTLAYMSPEQTGRMNRALDWRTDLYSLGITFYELLTGQRPFTGRDALEWFHAHLAQPPRPPHEVAPQVPPALSAVVLKLLAKAAEERYQGAEGLKADLERCRQALACGAREPFPLGEQDLPARFQLPQRLYGREAEVATLLECFERVAEGGRPELLLVSGYSGIGKSSVVQELHRPVLRRRGFFLHGKFDQLQRDIPYATLAQAIRGLVQHLLAGTDEELGTWRQHLRAAWGDNGQVLVELVPQLSLVVGPQPSVQELPPTEAQNRFNLVFQRSLGVFASAGRPLALFLDDLQWADLATLRLLQYLLPHPETPPLLLVGAYRDNEVGALHPLPQALEALRTRGSRVSQVQLMPLSLEQTRRLVADSLPGASREVVEPLATQVREKTGGNPFFLLQLLQVLYQDGLLSRLPGGGWRWEAEGVQARGYSDNVVELLAGRLRQLPSEVRHLLRLAACVGNVFELRMLALTAGQEEAEVERGLEPALQEGLVARGGPERYRFLHDRIQQAAYALTPEPERPALHLRIGRLWLATLEPAQLQEHLFDVVQQLNAGVALVSEPTERLQVAQLNAEAGARAKAAAAHRSAATYLGTASALLAEDLAATRPELAFQVDMDQATCEAMSGNSAEAHRLVQGLLARPLTRIQRAAAWRLRADMMFTSGQLEGALTCLLEALGQLGLKLSPHPTQEEVQAACEEVWALLGERRIESLVELPRMTDPDKEAVLRTLSSLFGPAYVTDSGLLLLHLARMVELSLRHGNADASVQGYVWFGLTISSTLKKYREGYAFGQLALDLVERHDFAAYRADALYCMQIVSYWVQPMARALELVRSAFHHALRSGNFQVACYCCNHIVADRLYLGHELAELYQEAQARLEFAQQTGFRDVRDIILHMRQHAQQLRGRTRSFDTLSGEGFDEERFEAELGEERMATMRCWYWIVKLRSRYMSGAFEQALAVGERARELSWATAGHIQIVDYHLYRALALASCLPEAPPARQQEYREALREHHQQLAEWAGYCAENFRAPERLVWAELARVEGRMEEALRGYEQAVQAARENGFIQFAALGHELAARFWQQRGMPTVALAYAREAHSAYRQWGAVGKARHLEAQWPLLVAATPASADTTSYDTTVQQLDALAVVKAQQAISSEIVLERLVGTLLRVVLESGGAQRAALLLPRGERLEVVAQENTGESAAQGLPWTLLAYVRRTQEHVLIGDASKAHPFSGDPALRQSRARSLLCLPLLRKGEFRGLLYLENDLATEAFSPDRLALLEHLASQAAISVENAQLYEEVQRGEAALRQANEGLEQRVRERTRELEQAQANLVSAARAAGMAEIASNVLHNVGNVLTSVVVDSELMRKEMKASRLGRLRQVVGLLEQNRADLGRFLTEEPKGRRLLDYLPVLSRELVEEQAALQRGLEGLERHIVHIQSIVQVQQAYAKTAALVVEECDLGQLIEDALRIQMLALQRHGVEVVRELAPLPKVRVDKHRLLQILINLISNAKYAMAGVPEAERRLVVRLRAEGERVLIQVVDSGMGIAPEVRERLFSHGFTTRREGHGFGLHSSALAAKVMGGNLELTSEGVGKGATATLEFPLALAA